VTAALKSLIVRVNKKSAAAMDTFALQTLKDRPMRAPEMAPSASMAGSAVWRHARVTDRFHLRWRPTQISL
jgi:hypothetical protein